MGFSNQKWAHIMYGTRYFEIERDGGFWAAMESDKKALKVMQRRGMEEGLD
jgi:hypothetical protein